MSLSAEMWIVASPAAAARAMGGATIQPASAAARTASSAWISATGSNETMGPSQPCSRSNPPYWPTLAPTSRTASTSWRFSAATSWAIGSLSLRSGTRR